MLKTPSRAQPEMENINAQKSSLPDALFAWTTSISLVAFGIIFFNDAVIMGRTILVLGLLSITNEALKWRAARSGSDYRRLRLVLGLTYLAFVLSGFFAGPAAWSGL